MTAQLGTSASYLGNVEPGIGPAAPAATFLLMPRRTCGPASLEPRPAFVW
jgi:hypothetical protein